MPEVITHFDADINSVVKTREDETGQATCQKADFDHVFTLLIDVFLFLDMYRSEEFDDPNYKAFVLALKKSNCFVYLFVYLHR